MPTALTLASDSSSDSEDEITITKETRGTVDKFSALATLDDSDYDIINDSSGWLTCDIVQAAHVDLDICVKSRHYFLKALFSSYYARTF